MKISSELEYIDQGDEQSDFGKDLNGRDNGEAIEGAAAKKAVEDDDTDPDLFVPLSRLSEP